MLQRVQSLFLALTGICMIIMVFWPIWSKTNPEGTEQFYFSALGIYTIQLGTGEMTQEYSPYITISILAFISAGIAIFEIFQYRNRLTQMKIGALNSVVMGVALGMAVYFVNDFDQTIMPGVKGVFYPGFYLPAVALLSNVVANRFIKRDEKIVRNADRMR